MTPPSLDSGGLRRMKQDIVTLERQTGHRNLVMRRRFNRLLRGGGLGDRMAAATAKAAALAGEKMAEAAALAREKAAAAAALAREKAAAKRDAAAALAQAKLAGITTELTTAAKQKWIASLDQAIDYFDTIIHEYEKGPDTKDDDIRTLVTCMFNGALRLKRKLPQMIETALSRTYSAINERDQYLIINSDLTGNYLNQGCYVHFDPRAYKSIEDKGKFRGGLPELAWSNKESLTVMTQEDLDDSVDNILRICTRHVDSESIIDKLKEIKKLKVRHAYKEHEKILVYRFIRPFEGET